MLRGLSGSSFKETQRWVRRMRMIAPSFSKSTMVAPEVTDMYTLESERRLAYQEEHKISVTGAGVDEALPFLSFSDAPFHPKLKSLMGKLGFSAPMPTQAQSWPILLNGRDLISVAKTGSGKTVGFLLPAFQMLLEGSLRNTSPKETMTPGSSLNLDDQEDVGVLSGAGSLRPKLDKLRSRIRSRVRRSPRVLILTPTRELTQQIETEARKFGKATGHHAMSVYGGAGKASQIRSLRVGVDVVVATPGRCYDLMKMGYLQTNRIEYLVLDEADQMLNFGFIPQIERIVADLPSERQSVFFTATWPASVRDLASKVVSNPCEVKIDNGADELTANSNIAQAVFPLTELEKEDALATLLHDTCKEPGNPRSITKAIVFCNRKDTVDDIRDDLEDTGYRVYTIHGDIPQQKRERVMNGFRKDPNGVLVATDVAARGLDINDIRLVVNYDMPYSAEQYVHRIGRTGRAERDGYAVTFFTRRDKEVAGDLIKVMKRAGQGEEIPDELVMYDEDMKNERQRKRDQHRGGKWRSRDRFNRGGGRGGGGGRRRSGGDRGGAERGGGVGSWSSSGSGARFSEGGRGGGGRRGGAGGGGRRGRRGQKESNSNGDFWD